MPALVVKPNSYDGAVCAPTLLATPDVSTEIAGVTFGDQSDKPGIDSRWSLSLNSFRIQKPASQRRAFDFTPEEGDSLVSVHSGGRQVVRILPRITSRTGDAEDRQGEANGPRNAVPARHLQHKKHEHDGKAAGVVQGPPISIGRTLQVVRVYHDDTDGLPVLVVEDLSERAAAPSSDVS